MYLFDTFTCAKIVANPENCTFSLIIKKKYDLRWYFALVEVTRVYTLYIMCDIIAPLPFSRVLRSALQWTAASSRCGAAVDDSCSALTVPGTVVPAAAPAPTQLSSARTLATTRSPNCPATVKRSRVSTEAVERCPNTLGTKHNLDLFSEKL